MNKYERTMQFWARRRISTGAELSAALNGQSIAFAYNSGKIENPQITFHDTREIFEHDRVTAYTGDLRTLFEIRGSRDAYEFSLESFDRRAPLDEEFIKTLHERLTRNTYDDRRRQLGERPGQYKLHDYVTGRNETGAPAEDVEAEMSELFAELAEIADSDALTAAAYFHAKFENIHPFADGNGRVGRLAMNHLLVTHNHPPITIHEEDRREYYAALEEWDERQELEPLKDFLREQAVKTWEKTLDRKRDGGVL